MSTLKRIEACLKNVEKFQHLNAIISIASSSHIRDLAREFDQNTSKRPLDGVAVMVKDNLVTRDLPTTCASKMLVGFKSPFDATVVSLLRDHGAIIMGKTNMDEFGMGSTSAHSFFGRVKNPRNEELVAGGSSGGSAVAVATEMCDIALGSDTGGSVRLPAAYCGVYGFKPSYGMLSRWGLVSYASSLDTVGLFAKDLDLMSRTFQALAQYDAQDPTSLLPRYRSEAPRLPNDRPLRIGIPVDYFPAEAPDELIELFGSITSKYADKAIFIPVSLPHTKYALPAYYIISSAEASSNLARYDGIRYGYRNPYYKDMSHAQEIAETRSQAFGKEVQRRIILGSFVLSSESFDAYFMQAQRVRRLVQEDFNNVFSKASVLADESNPVDDDGVDILMAPVSVGEVPRYQELSKHALSEYLTDVCTIPASLAGLPAISVPWTHGKAFQLIGQYGHDDVVLEAARLLASRNVQ